VNFETKFATFNCEGIEVGEQRPPLEEFKDCCYEGKSITPRASVRVYVYIYLCCDHYHSGVVLI